jgi:hypothetical protein
MARVLIFSRNFPAGHPRQGDYTFFIEKVLNTMEIEFRCIDYFNQLLILNKKALDEGRITRDHLSLFYCSLNPLHNKKKGHTIRESMILKTGSWFSPRCWFGVPYHDPQIIFAPDTQVKSTWTFEVKKITGQYHLEGHSLMDNGVQDVAANDGLDPDDFESWFRKAFKGQVICFDEKIQY